MGGVPGRRGRSAEGRSLEEMARRGASLSELEAARLILRTIPLLRRCHGGSPPRAHGNVGPSTISLAPDGRVSLAVPLPRHGADGDPREDIRRLGQAVIPLLPGRDPSAPPAGEVPAQVTDRFARILEWMAGSGTPRGYLDLGQLEADLRHLLAPEAEAPPPPVRPAPPPLATVVLLAASLVLTAVAFTAMVRHGRTPPAAPSPPPPVRPAPAPARVEAPPVEMPRATPPPPGVPAVEGVLLHDGRPVTEASGNPPLFWFRNERSNRVEHPRVEVTGERFRITGLSPGEYGMSVRIDTDGFQGATWPGDLDAWKVFDLPEKGPTRLEVHLRRIIRLTAPVDTGLPVAGWDGLCGEGTSLTAPVRFRWDPIDPEAVYLASVERVTCAGGSHRTLDRAFGTETAGDGVEVPLPPSGPDEYYAFHLGARKNGRVIGMLTTHGERGGLGWDYRFRVTR